MKKEGICDQRQGDRRAFVNVSTELRFSQSASRVLTEWGPTMCEEEMSGLGELGGVNKVAAICNVYSTVCYVKCLRKF
jgi:hypothetical protein